jgi:hypothetical protein
VRAFQSVSEGRSNFVRCGISIYSELHGMGHSNLVRVIWRGSGTREKQIREVVRQQSFAN